MSTKTKIRCNALREEKKKVHIEARKGNAAAQCRYAEIITDEVIYENNPELREWYDDDCKEALVWYRESAEQGYAKAQFALGFMYDIGRGVQQDAGEALSWFTKSAESGYCRAQLRVGMRYVNGKGVPQDDKEAVKWFRVAAEQGDATGQYNLGFMYEDGRGVPQDNKEAVKWYKKAAEGGNDEAQFSFARTSPQDSEDEVVLECSDGNRKTWYKNGQKKSDLDDGGFAREWYENGQIASEASDEGHILRWYKDGQIEGKYQFIDDELNGPRIAWHENGQKKCEGQMLNGKEFGLWTWWDEYGEIVQTETYVIKRKYRLRRIKKLGDIATRVFDCVSCEKDTVHQYEVVGEHKVSGDWFGTKIEPVIDQMCLTCEWMDAGVNDHAYETDSRWI